ncbi:CHASE2 domain-containing protein [Planctobacterium marinum]|uniref:CHASE2 domain-containing protein n=1 Tax=Planctobacterium marinum TaxID=1631968 RepID=UPI001E3E5306|nr:adenylate/guanylate cyclase domain-containing protein [Planctobacterium marinum]MCC2606034.1 adenylate/guanylate cyclase domain-containing protein [Planctobacterium marinum]
MTALRTLREHRRAILAGFGLVFLVFLLQFYVSRYPNTPLALQFNRIDGFIFDLRLKSTLDNRSTGFADIVIVDLDGKTMEAIGWPWPRARLAELVYNLADMGAVVVVFDVLFADRERNPAREVHQALAQKALALNDVVNLIEEMDGDKAFMESFDATDVMFSYLLNQSDLRRGVLPTHNISSDHPPAQLGIINYSGFESSIPEFHDASVGEGFMNSSPDSDGFIRRSPLVLRYGNKLLPSISLEAARLYALADSIEVKTQQAGNLVNVEGIKIGNQLIPTDAEGRVLIPYRGPQFSFPYISAIDVLNNQVKNPDIFDSSVVFIGTSAVGLADLRSTPVGVQFPGVEVHANVLEGLLDPSILKYRPDWWEASVALYIIILGIILAVMMPLLGPSWMAITGIIALGGSIYGNVLLWTDANIALPMASSILLVLLLMMYNIGTGFFAENKRRQQIKGIFDQYVPPAHIDKMLEEPDSVSMEGERKELSVLFSDIRSFTTISEKLSANELKLLLNRYFDPITETIFTHQGTIDKYVGDMVMAFWGAPLDDPRHAQNAVETAFEMLRITARLRKEFKADGLPEVKVGIGINTGDMNVGDMGSTFRKAYTVLGDAVNLGSRLEGLTKFYGVELLVSEATINQCEGIPHRRIDRVKVKGKNEAVAIVEPIAPERINDAFEQELTAYHKAYDSYLAQQWQQASEQFKQLTEANPKDILYTLYLERIELLKDQTLPDDWDGSYTHTSK